MLLESPARWVGLGSAGSTFTATGPEPPGTRVCPVPPGAGLEGGAGPSLLTGDRE